MTQTPAAGIGALLGARGRNAWPSGGRLTPSAAGDPYAVHGILGRALAPLGQGRAESEAAEATSRPAART